MEPAVLQSFRSSLLRCLSDQRFLDLFYREFTASSPEVARAFAHTDMDRQKAMLNASLYQLASLQGDETPEAREHVRHLGAIHGQHGHNIPPYLYDLWLDSLLLAAETCDPQWSPELNTLWKQTMSGGIDLMKSASDLNPSSPHDMISERALRDLIDELERFGHDAKHRSEIERDMEATAFQFGQYRAYLHASTRLRRLIDGYPSRPDSSAD